MHLKSCIQILSPSYKRDTGVLNVHEEAEELALFGIEKAEMDLIAVLHCLIGGYREDFITHGGAL